MSAQKIIEKVEIVNKLGLHIRPSRHFASIVNAHDAIVQVRNNDRVAEGDSQLDLLMLLASKGAVLEISASGPQAREVVDALVKLIVERFGEDE